VWVRCSQAGSGRRSVGDGVAEAEKVGQEGKKAGGGGGVPCGGAATGQHLLEVTQEPVVMILTHSYPFQNKHSAFKKRGASSEFSITVV